MSISLEISSRCVDRLAVEISWGADGPVTTKVVIPAWRSLYLTFGRHARLRPEHGAFPRPRRTSVLGIHIYRGAIRWTVAAAQHDWGRQLPWWRQGYLMWGDEQRLDWAQRPRQPRAGRRHLAGLLARIVGIQ